MSGISFLSDNLVDAASLSITTGSENAQFPLSNLQNDTTTRKFRSTGDTVVIELDLLQLAQIDAIAVVGDATSTLQITDMVVKTSVTTDFSGSPANNVPLSSEFNIGWLYITEVTHRFVEITLTGNGTFAEISNIFIGARLNLPQNSYAIDSFRYRHDDGSKIRRNEFGQKFIDVFPFRKRIVGTIRFCNKSEQNDLDDMFLTHGRNSPFWVIVDPDSEAMIDGQFKLAMYGYMNKMPSWNAVGGQLYNAGIEMDQVV